MRLVSLVGEQPGPNHKGNIHKAYSLMRIYLGLTNDEPADRYLHQAPSTVDGKSGFCSLGFRAFRLSG